MRAATLFLVLLFGLRAWADTGNPDIDKGVALYNDLEYEKAIDTLSAALARPHLSKQELTEGYRYLGLSYVAINKSQEAEAAFGKLLDANPRFELPRSEAPRALDLFDKARAAHAKPAEVQLVESHSPMHVHKGMPISFDIGVTDPDEAIAAVTVHYRVKGQSSFSSVTAQHEPNGRYSATVPGAFVGEEAIEYFVSATAANGQPLAGAGAETAPLSIAFEKVATQKKSSVLGAWWFWTGVGVAVAAGLVGGYELTRPTSSSNADANVTITVNYGP